jgi:hypothetical protein
LKILKSTDKIRLTTGTEEPISVTIRPMTVSQKIEIASKVKIIKGNEIQDHNAQALLCIKFCLLEISGVQNYDGSGYALEFVDGYLSDSCADDIMSCLSESSLLLPVVLGSNKNLGAITGVTIEVNPK